MKSALMMRYVVEVFFARPGIELIPRTSKAERVIFTMCPLGVEDWLPDVRVYTSEAVAVCLLCSRMAEGYRVLTFITSVNVIRRWPVFKSRVYWEREANVTPVASSIVEIILSSTASMGLKAISRMLSASTDR